MQTLDIEIHFVQPVRVIPWKQEERRKTDKAYLRGITFARWHMEKKEESTGVPYITGTMVRSALLNELAVLLLWYKPYRCCSRQDKTLPGVDEPVFMRKRGVAEFYKNETDHCTEHDPCILCLLKGRFDKIKRKDKVNPANPAENFSVHFSNPTGKRSGLQWKEATLARIVNRVDPITGKARDFFTLHEIDPAESGCYKGTITINAAIDPDVREKIKVLLAVGLAQVKVLGGSVCRINITNHDHNTLIKKYFPTNGETCFPDDELTAEIAPGVHEPKSADLAFEISAYVEEAVRTVSGLFEKKEKETRLRTLADIIRSLHSYKPETIRNLPTGKDGNGHFLWDKKPVQGGPTLRCLLEENVENIDAGLWREFCGHLGQEVYKLAKAETTPAIAMPRLLGEAEYFGTPQPFREEYCPSEKAPLLYWTVVGVLKAETPFFFGNQTVSGHISNPILLNRDGFFRIPASVLRGILRRDLRAVIGDGCNMPVGSRPCDCPVCHIMNRLVVEDALSGCRVSPETRSRIRINHHTGIVEEGALFDLETGYEGMTFPFRLYLRTTGLLLDDPLKIVLSLWKEGQAFLGGHAGVGYGRFSLGNCLRHKWDNTKSEECMNRLLCRDYTGQSLPKVNNGRSELRLRETEPKQRLWEPIHLSIHIAGPLLTRDTIRAMLDTRGPDAVMFRKAVFPTDANDYSSDQLRYRYVIKGESFRGVMRTAVARSDIGQEQKVYDIDHEACDCIQCRLFGSIHQQGALKCEDLEVTNFTEFTASTTHDIKMDHVAIDRFTGGGVDRLKYDDYPLPGSKNNPLKLSGIIWVKAGLDKKARQSLATALADLREGFLSLGGLGAIGYGHVTDLSIDTPPSWLVLPSTNTVTKDLTGEEKETAEVSISLQDSAVYHPYAFLPPLKTNVNRETDIVSHVKSNHSDEQLLTGKIHCRLTTLGPVFIPDTNNPNFFGLQEDHADHRNYGFFRISGQTAIPGSSIRGMVSSVYEALTHSCFRVMEGKKLLSWRMEAIPKKLKKFMPGRITYDKKTNSYKMEQLAGGIKEGSDFQNEHVVPRVPVYEDPSLSLPNGCSDITSASTIMRNNAEGVQNQITEKLLQGGKCKPIYAQPQDVDFIVENLFDGEVEGYFQFTGFNKMEKAALDSINSSNLPANIIELKDMPPFPRHNNIRCGGKTSSFGKQKPKDKIIPYCAVKDDKFLYTVDKRCERIFLKFKDSSKEKTYDIPASTIRRYRQLLEEYKINADRNNIPEIFRTRLPDPDHRKIEGGSLDGSLVFFRFKGDQVTDIAPVRISRIVDDQPLGKKFSDASLASCYHQCKEECDECPERCKQVGHFFSPHPRGLCPACHLFGTPNYKGRVMFQTAWPTQGVPIKWYKPASGSSGGGCLALPLLERPRPTWPLPYRKKEIHRKAENHRKKKIPGRKFYLHHPWSIDSLPITTPDANNTTVEPLAAGNVFEFDVAFHNLRHWELGLLLYALELKNGLGHKLGMGKSLGLGSVEITSDRLTLKEVGSDRPEDSAWSRNALVNQGFVYLKSILPAPAQDDLDNYMGRLHHLLCHPDNNSAVKVAYPKLKKKDDPEGRPGYVELKDRNLDWRRTMLTTPWADWQDDTYGNSPPSTTAAPATSGNSPKVESTSSRQESRQKLGSAEGTDIHPSRKKGTGKVK